jgi:hypothetical protein
MDLGLAALLSAGATTLVASMTTDSWEQVKAALVGLWRRRHPEQADAVSVDLAVARSGLVAARADGEEPPMAELLTEWQSRLRRLVTGDEELQQELRRFAEEFRHLLDAPDDAARVTMRAEVHGSGRVNQVGRDQIVINS